MELQLSKNLSVDAQELVTGRTCVLAQSGAGKSYLIAVLCEKALQAGIPFVIIDTEGEYFSLKEKFQLLWVGGNEADLQLDRINLRQLAERVVREGVPLIFDVSQVLDEKAAVAGFCQALYDAETRARTPYLLIVEEADKFAPQITGKDERTVATLRILEEIARRGRKRGLGMLIATQRPAMVNKNVLSQCGNQMIGKLTTENDLSAVGLFFSNRRELDELPNLRTGEFFAMGGLSRDKVRFMSFARTTQHRGLTPRLIARTTGRINELKEVLAATKPEPLSEPGGMDGRVRQALGIPAGVERERAEKIAEGMMKRRFLVGGREHLTDLELVWEPLVYAEAKLPGGVLRKDFRTVSFMLGAVNGSLADVGDGLSFRPAFEGLVGRTENEARTLLALDRKDTTLAELEGRTGLSGGTLREILKRLRSARLVTWTTMRSMNYYTPLVRRPEPELDRKAACPETKVELKGEAVKPVLTEKDLRSIIKALKPRAEVTEFRLFYYPVWRARLQGRDVRTVRIDGVTGKEL